METWNINESLTYECTLANDGDFIEVYLNGLFLACVKKRIVSDELREEIEDNSNK